MCLSGKDLWSALTARLIPLFATVTAVLPPLRCLQCHAVDFGWGLAGGRQHGSRLRIVNDRCSGSRPTIICQMDGLGKEGLVGRLESPGRSDCVLLRRTCLAGRIRPPTKGRASEEDKGH
jgi:hypothetical protein